MIDVPYIKEYMRDETPKYIYFLLSGEEVVYIGQTVNLHNRIKQHGYDKDFDRVFEFKCEEGSADLVEKEFIQKYSPKYNKAHLCDK